MSHKRTSVLTSDGTIPNYIFIRSEHLIRLRIYKSHVAIQTSCMSMCVRHPCPTLPTSPFNMTRYRTIPTLPKISFRYNIAYMSIGWLFDKHLMIAFIPQMLDLHKSDVNVVCTRLSLHMHPTSTAYLNRSAMLLYPIVSLSCKTLYYDRHNLFISSNT